MESLNFGNCFQYQLKDSAFTIVEYPTFLCQKAMVYSKELWNRDTHIDAEKMDRQKIKNRSLAVLIGTAGYLGGMIAWPITSFTTPIALLADIIIGIAECVFCAYNGVKEELKTIAHRKFKILPYQNLAFICGNITVLAAYLFFTTKIPIKRVSILFFWPLSYEWSKLTVRVCSYYDESLNIFVKKQKRLVNVFDLPANNPLAEEPLIKIRYDKEEWNRFINEKIAFVSSINDANLSNDYLLFKKRLLERRYGPEEILGLQLEFTEKDFYEKQRKFLFLFATHVNRPRQQEAEALTSVVEKVSEFMKNTRSVSSS